MRTQAVASRVCALLLGAALATSATSAVAQQAPGGAGDAQRVRILGQMTQQDQQAPANQAWLVPWMRNASRLFQRSLDGLACQALFSLGTETLFNAAVGPRPGAAPRAVFILGDGNPQLEPYANFYVFPANTWERAMPSAERNTAWHELQHGLLTDGGLGVAAAPFAASIDDRTDADDQHPFIEGVGLRGAQAYGELLAFEEAVRRADRLETQWLSEGRDPSDYALQRQAWADAHQRFSEFQVRMRRVANIDAALMAQYRALSGIWFSTTEQVAEFYRNGGLKRTERGEVLPLRPPRWVFSPELFLMPVQLTFTDADRRDLEEPGAMARAPFDVKSGVFRQSILVRVRARGSALRLNATAGRAATAQVIGTVRRGQLRIRIVEDEPLVGMAISQGAGATVDGQVAPGGPSTHLFTIDLSRPDPMPVRITFVRRQLSLLKAPTAYHVAFEYTDAAADRLYDASSAQLTFTVDARGPAAGAAGNAGVSGSASGTGATGPTASGTASTAPAAPASADARVLGSPAEIAARKPNGIMMTWAALPDGMVAQKGSMYDPDKPVLPSAHTMELNSGPSVWFEEGKVRGGNQWFVLEIYSRTRTQNFTSLQNFIDETDPPGRSKYGRGFTHRETTVAGFRTFESTMNRWTEYGGQHHLCIEVDPQRHIYIWLLTDQKWWSQKDPNGPVYIDHYARFVNGMKFKVPLGAALALSRAVEKPVPKALTDAVIENNEIVDRAPPPPAEPTRRRRGGGAATTPAAAGGTSTAGTGSTTAQGNAPAGSGSGATGGNSGAGAGAGAGAAGSTTAAPGGANAPPNAPPNTPPSAPPSAPKSGTAAGPPATPYEAAADASGVLNGRGVLEFGGGAPVVVLNNDSRAHWTRCVITAPGKRTRDIGTLPAQTGRDYPLNTFKGDANAASLTTEAQLQCAEGRLRIPADLSTVNLDTLTAALDRAAKNAQGDAMKAVDKVKSALGGLFRKKP